MRDSLVASGDLQTAEALRIAQAGLGRSLQQGGTLIDNAVGILLEKSSLKGTDSPAEASRLEELNLIRDTHSGGASKISSLMTSPDVPESDWLLYFDKIKQFGENAANEWMLEEHPNP